MGPDIPKTRLVRDRKLRRGRCDVVLVGSAAAANPRRI